MRTTKQSKELNALITLLEDPDGEVIDVVTRRILDQGIRVVPVLEKAWESLPDEQIQQKLEGLIHLIQFNDIKVSLTEWVNNGGTDLLKGACIVARYQFPSLQEALVEERIEAFKRDVWLELNSSLTALEKVKTLNHILFGVHRFSGSTANFFAPHNHYINQVLENRKGGPVSLSILYSVIAQRLGLPILGVSLPRNFLLGYVDYHGDDMSAIDPNTPLLFYINPFNKGTVLGRKEIELYLSKNNIPEKETYYTPCSNRTIIAQLVGSLMIAYQKTNQLDKISELQELLDIATGR